MGARDKIDLRPYRQPAAEAYAADVVDPNSTGLFSADFVNELIQTAYLAGVSSIAPESATARYEHTLHFKGGNWDYRSGSYRQRTRAITERDKIIQRANPWVGTPEVSRRVVIECEWEGI